MAKKSFFKPVKQVQKELTGSLISAGIGAGSAIGTAYAINALKPMIKEPKLLKFMGAITCLSGYALAAFATDQKIVTVGHSIGAVGAYQAALDMSPVGSSNKIQMTAAFSKTEKQESIEGLESNVLSALYEEEMNGMDEDDEIEGIDEDDEIEGFEDDEIEGIGNSDIDDESELANSLFQEV